VREATERLQGDLVTSSFFDVLGVAPRPGRNFLRSEEEGRAPVAIVSRRLWESRFEGAPDVLGKSIRVNGRDLTVVGVAPEAFRGITIEHRSMFDPPYSSPSSGRVADFGPRDQLALDAVYA
jgi:hypothetical protein